jgi:chorismate lyase/3-hydroxybenzoate synthase
MLPTSLASRQAAQILVEAGDLRPPAWVSELSGASGADPVDCRVPGAEMRVARGTAFSHIEVVLPSVREMDLLTFQRAVAEVYEAIFDLLEVLPTRHPVRFWSFVPDIQGVMGPGLDRYMAFNAGRFAAYADWCGAPEAIGRSVATASAVGAAVDRLVVHCLASRDPGTPVENPRQIPAHRYSRRYGPLPPCFARATSIRCALWPEPRLLVGGTASICGESSMHIGDLAEQIRETLANLASLVRSACAGQGAADGRDAQLEPWLARFRELRIYVPNAGHGDEILERVMPYFAGVGRVELLEAQLCRAELLVEVEGVADMAPEGAGVPA